MRRQRKEYLLYAKKLKSMIMILFVKANNNKIQFK